MTIEKREGVGYYNSKLKDIAIKSMENMEIPTRIGTYGWTLGPTYETQAEVNDIYCLGGDAVGMSTYPEYLETNYLKMKIMILSCLSNYTGGNKRITHNEVLSSTKKIIYSLSSLLKEILLSQQTIENSLK